MTTVEEIISEAVRLLLGGGAPLWAVMAMVLGAALLVVMGRKIHLPPSKPEVPPPPAEWNQDPEQGAVVVPGPPGGTEEQNQSG